MRNTALSSVPRHNHAYYYLTLLALSLGGVDARPTLTSRAIIRPIPMSGFNVSVTDDVTGAPIPQVQASDGGGLIGGSIFSAPNIIWAIFAAIIGIPLGVAGVRLWRVTTALGGGLTLAFAMWAALINTISENGLASSQSMSDMLILLITGAAFLVGMVGGAFRIIALPAMVAICVLGGLSVAARGVILRPGLLVPPGPNQQLAFVNLVIVAVGGLSGGLSVIFKQRESMIFSTSFISSFLAALAVDLLVNGQDGMSRGLRSLFDMNNNHLADLVGGGYHPPLSSQITVASSLGLALILCIIQHFAFPGPFQRPRSRDRTQSITDSTSAKGSSPSPQTSIGRAPVAPGPIWRTSVLSLFRVPGRSSNAGSSQQMVESGVSLAGKSSNKRRGSTAYNYGQGVYALSSNLLRRESQARNQAVNSPQPNIQRPLAAATLGRSQQLTGIGLRGYQAQLFTARNNNRFRNVNGSPLGAIQYGGAQRVAPPPLSSRGTYAHSGTLHNTTAQTAATSRSGSGINPTSATDSTNPRIPRIPAPRTIPPSGTAAPMLPPPADVAPEPTSRLGTGMGVLRMSVDSIIDAYGGATDSGYRYGGSRTGEGVSHELTS
ncbi:unnamed protein product [Rhizoctonia solani]|uniref:TM7S3/TM198-like domain-containing protein n=1 Tax=Rhizoctonia solani TaxID=456999 RepID=A0A8H3AYS4_9AGAM|nr:unnamed protein product [Rhizoctonia solani]